MLHSNEKSSVNVVKTGSFLLLLAFLSLNRLTFYGISDNHSTSYDPATPFVTKAET